MPIDTLKDMADGEPSPLEIDVLPPQAQQLALTEAGPSAVTVRFLASVPNVDQSMRRLI